MTTYLLPKRLAALALLTALGLAGCGGSDDDASSSARSSATPAAGPHNNADVAFAADMVPHHAQAVEMADMAADSATDERVKTLAADIKSAQEAEILQMTGWLKGWGEGTPDTSMMGMPGMDHAPGMMSDADMAALGKARGATFDRSWVQLMIKHHQGALVMAREELRTGANAAAKQLASSIIASQTAQIVEMRTLLGDL